MRPAWAAVEPDPPTSTNNAIAIPSASERYANLARLNRPSKLPQSHLPTRGVNHATGATFVNLTGTPVALKISM
jgi:hypothetical protein